MFMTFDYFTGFINYNLIEETEALNVMSEVTRDNYDRGEKPWMFQPSDSKLWALEAGSNQILYKGKRFLSLLSLTSILSQVYL